MPLLQGENPSQAPLSDARPVSIENGVLTGTATISAAEDWRLAATLTDGGGSPVTASAVVGVFPFATQGGASAPSAGIAFSYKPSTTTIYLHQLDVNGAVLRTLVAWTGYTGTQPPQITGFEMFGKFYANAYGREAASARRGLLVFDPTGAGTVTVPTYDLSGGGVGAAALRFRGIAKHRGATILGWGYFTEESGSVDQPHIVRYSEYGAPDTWVPDGTPTQGSFFGCGTLNLPVVAAAASGQYTVIGKVGEVFVLDGDYSEQLYLRQIGSAHGPVSTTGMTTTGPLAVWMSDAGPAYSENGSAVRLLATERVFRRMQTYFDLSYATAVHDAARSRVGFLLRRSQTLEGAALTTAWADQLWWWDYQRDEFTVQSTPSTCFTVGTLEANPVTLDSPGPAAPPNTLAATNLTRTSATVTWVNGDTAPETITQVEYRQNGTTPWTVLPSLTSGVTSVGITGLTAATAYDVRVQHVRNNQASGYVTATPLFTTLTLATTAAAPTNLAVTDIRVVSGSGGTGLGGFNRQVTWGWTQTEFSSGATTQVLTSETTNVADGAIQDTFDASLVSYTITQPTGTGTLYLWVRHNNVDNLFSAWVGPVSAVF